MIKQKISQMEPNFDKAEVKAMTAYFNNNGWGGEYIKTEEMEKMIAKYTGAKHSCVTVNGTVSLIMAMPALGLKAGDEVLVPDMTMIASPNSVKILGIKPVLVDIEEKTLCLDLEKAEKLITPKTKALMYVAFNGRSGNMERVVDFCKKHKLFLVEDSAQALGSFWQGKHLGTFGDIGSFSFSTAKIITTGQGGALVTNDRKLYSKLEKIKDFGRVRGGIDIHDEWGWNFKFSDFLAVIGIEQLKKLKSRVKRKKEMFSRFRDNLKDLKQVSFIETDLKNTAPWFVDIFVDSPEKLAKYLQTKGIEVRRIYPAIHSQTIYKNDYRGVSFSVAEKVAKTGLWLPSSTKLSNNQIDYITGEIIKYYKK